MAPKQTQLQTKENLKLSEDPRVKCDDDRGVEGDSGVMLSSNTSLSSSSPPMPSSSPPMPSSSPHLLSAAPTLSSSGLTRGSSPEAFPPKQGWFLRLMRGPHATIATVIVAFAESSFFPLPPDIGIVSIVLHDRSKAWTIAFWCTVASVLGGFLGYAIGAYLFDVLGHRIIDLYGLGEKFESLRGDFMTYGFWIIAFKGLMPVPFKLLTISSGVFALPLGEFAVASILARAIRFYILSSMLWYFGPFAKPYLERFFGYIMIGMIGIIILGFLLVKLVL